MRPVLRDLPGSREQLSENPSAGEGGRTRRRASRGRGPTASRVLAFGEPGHLARLREHLDGLGIPVEGRPIGRDGFEPGALASAAALVLVPPSRPRASSQVAVLREAAPEIPLFVAVVTPRDPRDADLYRAGAAAVFAWPDERSVLRNTLRDMLGGPPLGRATPLDRSLRREIAARLRATHKAEPNLRIEVYGAIAKARGEVDRLWKKRQIELLISRVPGIRATDLGELSVAPSGRPDREIARELRALLRGATSIDDRTLDVSVHDGHAVVTGTAINREEWEHSRELITLSRGVRSVTDRTQTEPSRKRSDRQVARRLQEALRALVPGSERIRPCVVGQVVVLTGRAPLSARREAQRLAERDPGSGRIVNRIEVVPEGA